MRNGRTSTFVVVLIVIVLLLLVPFAYLWLSAPRIPQVVLPEPNGYSHLLQVGGRIVETPEDIGESDAETLRQFVQLNADALADSVEALQLECVVPVEYTAAYQQRLLDEVSSLRQVARLLWADARLAELDGDPDAAEKYTRLVTFNRQVANGGLLIHLQLGMGYQHRAWQALLQQIASMNATQKSLLSERLETAGSLPDDVSDYLLREKAISTAAHGWYITLVASRSNTNPAEEATMEKLAKIGAIREQVISALNEP